jgi:hypothetical protein
MTAFNSNLLRRTAAAIAAVAALSISAFSQAAVVTLSGTTGSSCSYSSMSVAPDGSFTVLCTSTTPVQTSDAGSFAFLSATGSAPNLLTNAGFPVVRSGGTTGTVTMNYTVSGAGCTNGVGSLSFADGVTSQNAYIFTLATGSCTMTLGTPSTSASVTTAPRLGSPATIDISVAGGTITPTPTPGPTPAPTPSASCPTGYTEPSNLLTANLGGPGNVLLQMAGSNQITALPLPDPQAGYSTAQVAFGESAGGAYTPQPVTLYISISKCRGYIDTDTSNRCNIISTNGNYNSITWFAQGYSVITDSTSANARGYCWAPKSEGQWYVNTKWSYSNCAFGAQICGFAIQQNYGPY